LVTGALRGLKGAVVGAAQVRVNLLGALKLTECVAESVFGEQALTQEVDGIGVLGIALDDLGESLASFADFPGVISEEAATVLGPEICRVAANHLIEQLGRAIQVGRLSPIDQRDGQVYLDVTGGRQRGAKLFVGRNG
jgi:hypothetical protein